MLKKAIRNTIIFTLIIINLIMWPSLFSDFFGDSPKEASVDNKDSSGQSTTKSEDEAIENSKDASNDEKTEDSAENIDSSDASFKILQIE
ncbi:hypothetical protein J2Z40_002953 [Cytobacillus eiseniae]|uniref:Uncharacterized protein n=1 Tax=Cytobacillus eiseniae TaxID=762947 RepID=A0ABS4RHK3_9BACI|nr:hypothetical protein [Cytobacillus eiseniae]MBP2242379.1 hypothetical protein [Cytobacillus eiseniae]